MSKTVSLVTSAHEMYAELKATHYDLTGHKLLPKLTYACYGEPVNGARGKYYGYFCLRLKPKYVYVLWVYAIGGGVQAMKEIMKVSKALKVKHKEISSVKLSCSIDPGEEKNTVLRRVNFYIKCGFRVYKVDYKGADGVSLGMTHGL